MYYKKTQMLKVTCHSKPGLILNINFRRRASLHIPPKYKVSNSNYHNCNNKRSQEVNNDGGYYCEYYNDYYIYCVYLLLLLVGY